MAAEINQVSCGCCSNGCVCANHMDISRGIQPGQCDQHRSPVPAKDWRLIAIVDRGPGHHYRFQVRGENLNYPEGHMDREFSWSVPNIDDPRYDIANAVREKSVALETLATGVHFRHAGYPDKFKVYVTRGNGWYSSDAGYDGGPWHSPELHVVVIEQ